MTPETVVATLERLAFTILQLLAATTAVAVAMRAAIPALRAWAERSANKRDDAAVSKLEFVLDWLIRACDVVRRFLPHVAMGPLPRTQPLARSLPPRSSVMLPGPPPMPMGVQPMRPLSVPPAAGKALRDEGDG
jgi:hypothetical protein